MNKSISQIPQEHAPVEGAERDAVEITFTIEGFARFHCALKPSLESDGTGAVFITAWPEDDDTNDNLANDNAIGAEPWSEKSSYPISEAAHLIETLELGLPNGGYHNWEGVRVGNTWQYITLEHREDGYMLHLGDDSGLPSGMSATHDQLKALAAQLRELHSAAKST